MSIYRAYSKNKEKDDSFLLVHGNPDQKDYELYGSMSLVHPVVGMKANKLRQALFISKGLKWLIQNRSEFDVFFGLTSYQYSVMPAVFVKKILGKPAFVRVASSKSDLAVKDNWTSRLGSVKLRRKFLANITGVIAISNEIKNELRLYGVPEELIFHVPNGVDTVKYNIRDDNKRRKTRQGLKIKDRFTVLFVGSLARRKQPHLAIEAVAKCIEKGYILQIILLGPQSDKTYHSELRKLVKAHNLHDHVYFRDFDPCPENYYHAANVFVLPSLKEGMSNAMLEAASCGLPIVVSGTSGARELFEKGCGGKIVNVSSSIPMTDAIMEYIENENLVQEHGMCSRLTMEKYFDSNLTYQSHMKIFKNSCRN